VAYLIGAGLVGVALVLSVVVFRPARRSEREARVSSAQPEPA
jgi:hypothetical protein